ncbi:MAG: LCP family protein [Acidimicrobiales bacterium]|nr:LCP family protein [Acidimicrobiales bacterium]
MSARRSARAGKPRRTWPQRIVIGTGVLVAFSCALTATGLAYGKWKFDQVEHYEIELVQAASGEPENFLIVGSDSRDAIDPDSADADIFLNGESGGERSDSMMVARIDPSSQHVDLLSVPRDLWVTIPGGDPDEHHRINEAYAGGRQQLIETIEANLGIDINHYLEVDFTGFKELVAAIDGVPTYFDTAWRDTNSGLDIKGEGCVTLNPDQALAYARARHLQYYDPETGEWDSDPTGDLGRMNRQQLLVVNAIDEAVSLELANPARLNRLINVGVDNVGVDPGFTFDDMVSLAKAFSDTNSEDISRHNLEVEDYRTDGGAAVLTLDEATSQPVLNIFRGLDPDEITEAMVTVDVVNGSGVDGQAQSVMDAMVASGFTPGAVGGDMTPVAATEVHYAPGSERAADLVARHLTAGGVLVEDESLDPFQVSLVTGPDFTTVQQTARPPAAATGGGAGATTTSSSTTSTTIGHSAGDPAAEGIDCD